jgi:hypothetical protein
MLRSPLRGREPPHYLTIKPFTFKGLVVDHHHSLLFDLTSSVIYTLSRHMNGLVLP